jgi:oligopeptide/dipeptide ABC transporter ATP-binding protein
MATVPMTEGGDVNLLEVANVSVDYSAEGARLLAVSDVSMHVDPGEIVALVGDSGSGKSTLVLALLGLTRAGGSIVSGSIRFEGKELIGAKESELARIRGSQIGFITQHPKAALNPVMRVGTQLALALRAHDKHLTNRDARARARDLFGRVGIADPERRLQAYPHELSGGMAQRILIAIALAGNPSLLLADEPTSGLDVTMQAQILDDLKEKAREVGSSLVLVTHDLGIVANYADRVYLMNSGEVVEACTVDTFFRRPAHPAALALMAVQQESASDEFNRRHRLRGLPVDRRHLPEGCWLHPRCPFAEPDAGCATTHPQLEIVASGHSSRCHRTSAVLSATTDLVDSAG